MRKFGTLMIALLAAGTTSCSLPDAVQRKLVFRPVVQDWAGYSPEILNQEEIWIPVGTAGERLHAWWLASPQAAHTVLYFHGARVNLSGSVYRLRAFRDAGYNVLAIDYRGFGKSAPALPSERSVYEDAEAAWRWLDTRVPDRRRRILYGHSLGGAVAAEVALRGGNAAALVLESTFTSIGEMAPRGLVLTQGLDLLGKLEQLELPVLIIHGAQDEVVPPEMARRLYRAARGPKRLLMVEGAGHHWVAFRAGDALYDALQEIAATP